MILLIEYKCKRCNKVEKNIKKEVYELRKGLCGNCYYIKSELQDIIDRLYFIGSRDEIDDENFTFIASAKRQLETLLEKMYV
jgi:hypothetical protein